MEAHAGAPTVEQAAVPVVGVAAKEVQPEPSLVGDVAGGASGEDTSESETKGKVGAGKIEELEDLFVSGSEDHGGDGGAGAKEDKPVDTANQQQEDIPAFPDEE